MQTEHLIDKKLKTCLLLRNPVVNSSSWTSIERFKYEALQRSALFLLSSSSSE